MLTPDYLLHMSEGAEAISEELHQDIINRIVDRIMRRLDRGDDYILTAQDKWQIETLQEAGYLLEDIQKEIANATPYMQSEIAEAMEEACVMAISYDDAIYKSVGLDPKPLEQSPYMTRLMQRNYEATLGEWKNFTGTMANAAQQSFIDACSKAYTQVSSGMISYSQALLEAINSIVSDGVTVTYPSGHTDTIETATLRAVRTGVSQATAQIQLTRMDEMNVDLVIVSSHLGARPEHQVWQGKIYHVDFATPQFVGNQIVGVSRSSDSSGYPDLVSSTKYGSVTGLCGANCRHNFSPYFPGMDNPFKDYDSKENKEAYEIQQQQRLMERRIRKSKREAMGLKTSMDGATTDASRAKLERAYQRKAALLQKQNKAYNDYCEANDLKRLQERLSIAKWDRSQAAKARAAAKRWKDEHSQSVP